jgi:sigma-E factor negative regulatory protein RseA
MKSHSAQENEKQSVETAERISALMDGEIEPQQLAPTLKELRQQGAYDTWQLYHLIGDTLRSADLAMPANRDAERKLMIALAAEPAMIVRPAHPSIPALRRHALSSGAVAAAVLMIGWLIWPQFSVTGSSPSSAQLVSIKQGSLENATTPATRQGKAVPPPMPGLAEYVMAHQQFSPSVASYGVAPMARGMAPATIIEASATKE